MQYKIPFFFILVFVVINCISAQNDTLFNQTDSKGLKQGFWKKEYPNKKPMYKGYFKDGKPYGEMRKFYENGDIKAIMIYDEKNEHVKIKIYYEGGNIAAQGNYYQEKKDSIWNYYSYYSGTLIATENYDKGIKNGIEKHFYESGNLSEEISWQNNMREGNWNQYFEDGKPKMKSSSSSNKLQGSYSFYYPNGQLYIIGSYVDNKRNGKWIFYDDNGKEKSEMVYNNGKAENEKEITEKDQEFFKNVEQNLGKYQDPSPDDFVPGKGY
jgi:antitoxin component YwqK of YwqJK toxin-antitoxin module